MIRRIIKIDEEKCNGCGACAAACHEGAIGMVDGKARLLKDDYCDGLGDCLPACPTGAISFEEREAAAYDEEAVKKRLQVRAMLEEGMKDFLSGNVPAMAEGAPRPQGGCPGSMSREIKRDAAPAGGCPGSMSKAIRRSAPAARANADAEMEDLMGSRLSQWPVQIKLAPINAPYFQNAKLLIAADCTAYAYGNFHNAFIDGHVTLIGCPKLDMVDYSEKLAEIIRQNDLKSITVVRMEVPCCGGIEQAVKRALMASGKMIPWQVYTISTDGRILD